jgi:flagellar biogenesis protein FliO
MRRKLIEFYLKSFFVLGVLVVVLFIINKYIERKRLLTSSGIENLRIVPLGSGEKLVIFFYKGEEYVIFSTSHSAILLKAEKKN